MIGGRVAPNGFSGAFRDLCCVLSDVGCVRARLGH